MAKLSMATSLVGASGAGRGRNARQLQWQRRSRGAGARPGKGAKPSMLWCRRLASLPAAVASRAEEVGQQQRQRASASSRSCRSSSRRMHKRVHKRQCPRQNSCPRLPRGAATAIAAQQQPRRAGRSAHSRQLWTVSSRARGRSTWTPADLQGRRPGPRLPGARTGIPWSGGRGTLRSTPRLSPWGSCARRLPSTVPG
jgi:hypothetical protein